MGFFLLHLLALAALGQFIRGQMQPVDLPALHLDQGEKLHCVSYSPYYQPGQTPLDPSVRILREQIIADLKALAPLTACVRIYSVNQGLEQVPGIAQTLGLKVLLGAWIGLEADKNRIQIDTAVRLANEFPDTVRAVVVGNEVLLRREQTEAGLRTYIDEVRKRVKVPVTYADVWEFWTRHSDLASAVDFVTVHILPYWEDRPVAIEHALQHVTDVRALVVKQFSKPILIGETGWPSEGRQREAALPSRANQARYLREFIRKAHDEGWDYNFIEAIDQPWKRRLEGTVGGYWGILDTDLKPKFSWTESVAERSGNQWVVVTTLTGAILGFLTSLAGVIKFSGRGRPIAVLAAAAGGAFAGAVAELAIEHAGVAYRSGLEWGVLMTLGVAGLLIPFLVALWAGCRPLTGGLAAWREGRGRMQCDIISRQIALVRFLVLFGGAAAALLLFADPRYRDFPTLLYAVPALSLASLAMFAPAWNRPGLEERCLAGIILLCGVGRWVSEPTNPQAILWASCCLVLALGGGLGKADQGEQGGQEPHR
ncbi:MAG: beta-1,6-glucan synthase [Zoogloeaceae bacterium]|nr:beta-1,6-glucan synthase [Zoogloeaceae bacterium]